MPRPLYAAAGGRSGTRFVPPASPTPSLYLALDADTAHREGNQRFYKLLAVGGGGLVETGGLRADEVVLLTVFVDAARLLDTRDGGVQAAVGGSPAELAGVWAGVPDAPAQRLGHAVAADGGFDGLVYDSVRNPGRACLVLFPDRFGPGTRVDFRSTTPGLADARLPPVAAPATQPAASPPLDRVQ